MQSFGAGKPAPGEPTAARFFRCEFDYAPTGVNCTQACAVDFSFPIPCARSCAVRLAGVFADQCNNSNSRSIQIAYSRAFLSSPVRSLEYLRRWLMKKRSPILSLDTQNPEFPSFVDCHRVQTRDIAPSVSRNLPNPSQSRHIVSRS